jgi:rhodanese-related sulfurtransferase
MIPVFYMNENKSLLKEIFIFTISAGFILFTILFSIHHHFKARYIDPSQFEPWVESNKPVLVDLREETEKTTCALKYQLVIKMPFLLIQDKLDKIQLPRDREVLFVCSDGNRARLVSNLLREKGVHSYYLRAGLARLPSTSKLAN